MTRYEPNQSRPFDWSWNGGWFGIQFGGTCWMLIEGLLILRRDLLSGLACLLGCLVLNAIGLFVWSRRSRWRPYPAIQVYLAIMSVIVTIVVLIVKARGADDAMSGAVWTHLPYWALAVTPAAMVLVAVIKRGTTRQLEPAATQEGRDPDRV